MKIEEFVTRLRAKQKEDILKQKEIERKYKDLDKTKKLTQEQRIARIEELLGIE